jgi:uncharacterized protein (DUF433 family)
MDVLELLAAGSSETEILEDYPYLEADDIPACREFATTTRQNVIGES